MTTTIELTELEREMLAALKNLLAGPNWPGAQMTARAAIAKAEGR